MVPLKPAGGRYHDFLSSKYEDIGCPAKGMTSAMMIMEARTRLRMFL
jgi:hypothetical protein